MTPGPWMINEVNALGDYDEYHIYIEPHVAIIERTFNDEKDMADARLIASAPDLLAALQSALPLLRGHQETPERVARYERAISAITKATGGKA